MYLPVGDGMQGPEGLFLLQYFPKNPSTPVKGHPRERQGTPHHEASVPAQAQPIIKLFIVNLSVFTYKIHLDRVKRTFFIFVCVK